MKETQVSESQAFRTATGTGIAVLTRSYRIYVVNNVHDPRVRKLTDIPGTSQYIPLYKPPVYIPSVNNCTLNYMPLYKPSFNKHTVYILMVNNPRLIRSL